MASELVIFDCDGVLIDSELIACRSSAACLAEIGIPITADEIAERYMGGSTTAMFADLETRFATPLPLGFAEKVRRHVMSAFDSELVAMPGIDAVLATIKSPVCVASSSTPERLRHTLSHVGLFSRFDPHIFSATQVERGKPAPDLFLFAAEQIGVKPCACLVIEDSVVGVTAAVSAGMYVIGFTGGSHCRPGHSERLRQAGANQIIADFRDLAGATSRLAGDHMTAGSRAIASLFACFRKSWSVETGLHWKPDNPEAGQCGVTALVVNDELGGMILKTDVNGAWHFYNFVDGRRLDFTMSQFSGPIFYDDIPSGREEALLDCSQEQYDLLRSRVKSIHSVMRNS